MNPEIKRILIEELSRVISMWADEKEILVAMRLTQVDFDHAAAAAVDRLVCAKNDES